MERSGPRSLVIEGRVLQNDDRAEGHDAVTIVRTAYGDVQGAERAGIHQFYGVPYASKLIGSAWLEPPIAPTRWTGVRPALVPGPSAPQVHLASPFDDLLTAPVPTGSDCLNLNVWTPAPGITRAPVMLWIHGGAFSAGSGSDPWYDGSAFARDGVVLVSINYRLGPLGFGAFHDLFPGLGSTGSCGLLDQLAALQWVQENIHAFGGDPGNVTIFGESAGAMSICALMASPMARGLFRRAICQSGNANQSLPPSVAMGITRRLLSKLGVSAGDLDSLVSVGPDDLMKAASELMSDVRNGHEPGLLGEYAGNINIFEPLVDGLLLPAVPIEAIAAGSASGVDLLVGTTAEEWRLLSRLGNPPELRASDVVNKVAEYVGVAHAAAVYEAYGEYLQSCEPTDIRDAIETDRFFEIPTLLLAGAQALVTPDVYLYQFAWRSPTLISGGIGACHMLEIPFVFDNFENALAQTLVGAHHPQALADSVHRAWISFAMTGVPSAAGLPAWPRFHRDSRLLMRLDEHSSVVEAPVLLRPLWRHIVQGLV